MNKISLDDFKIEVIEEDEMMEIISGKNNNSTAWSCMTPQTMSIAGAFTGMASGRNCCAANTCTEAGCC